MCCLRVLEHQPKVVIALKGTQGLDPQELPSKTWRRARKEKAQRKQVGKKSYYLFDINELSICICLASCLLSGRKVCREAQLKCYMEQNEFWYFGS